MARAESDEVHTKEYVCGLLFVDDHVALIRKLRPGWQRGRVNGIGGKVEPGELPVTAMSREFQEEAGRHISPEVWIHFCTLINYEVGYRVFFYSADVQARDGVVTCEDEEVFWSHVDDLPSSIMHNLRWMIPLARDPDVVKPVEVVDGGSV